MTLALKWEKKKTPKWTDSPDFIEPVYATGEMQ